MASNIETEQKELSAVLKGGIENDVKGILRTERANWLERHRGAVVKDQVTFYHPIIDKTYERDYEKMSQYLYFIPVFGRILLKTTNHKDVVKIETHVHNSLLKNVKHVEHLIRQANVTFLQAGVDAPATFSGGVSFEAPLTSPLGRLYLELLQRADTFLMLMSSLWIRGLLHEDFQMNGEKRTQFEMEIKRLVFTVNFSILTQHRAIMNRLRRQEREQNVNRTRSQERPQAKTSSSKPASSDPEVKDAPLQAVNTEKPARKKADSTNVAAAAPAQVTEAAA